MRSEYREERFNPTATVLVRLDTIELHSKELQFVGYGTLNAFVKSDSMDQPSEASTVEFSLNAGEFQIPLMQVRERC